MSFPYKTQPRDHQRKALQATAVKPFFALTMEQGTGKTKVVIDTASALHMQGKITGLLVVAPNTVHRQWVTIEIPKHMPEITDYAALPWTGKAGQNRKIKAAMADLLESGPALRVLTVNYEALRSKDCVDFISKFLKSHKVLFVLDEAHRIKNPSAKTTRAILKLGEKAAYRRILTGTPVARSPLDVYAPYQFLSDSILRYPTFSAFRAQHAVLLPPTHPLVRSQLEKMRLRGKPAYAGSISIIATDSDGKPKYKNLEQLQAKLQPYTFRVLKKDCLDLPPKVYAVRHVALHPLQEAAIAKLRALVTMGANSVEEASGVISPMVAVLYYQQILCGVIPEPLRKFYGDAPILFPEPAVNPRMAALLDELEEVTNKAIIWCRFTHDIVSITAALKALYGEESTAAFYGEVSPTQREEIMAKFQDRSGPLRWFVGNPQAGGTGLTLTAAEDVIYYSNSFKFLDRLQSEDRCHRIGTVGSVRYLDLVVPDSVDEHILRANEAKMDLADAITGDSLKELFR